MLIAGMIATVATAGAATAQPTGDAPAPQNVMKIYDFMHRTGSLKTMPASSRWRA